MIIIDTVDLKIIDVLKENSRSSTLAISKKVNLSISAVSKRISKMEEEEIIEKFTIKVNREKMNYKLLAFVFVNIDISENVENFKESVVQYNCVLECHRVVDEYDYLLKVLVEDTKALEHFLSNTLKEIKGVLKSNTIISLSSLKENINI